MAYDFDVAFVNIFINTIICSYCKLIVLFFQNFFKQKQITAIST